MNEQSWKRLLQQIRDGNNLVVPIIGSRLLVAPDGSSLMAPIARRILGNYGVNADALPAFRELNDAVVRIKAAQLQDFDLQNLYADVDEELRSLGAGSDAAIPEPIRQLAQIVDFRLMVTLTPDDLLARSLRRRRPLTEIIHSPNLPTREGTDLPADWQDRRGEGVPALSLREIARGAELRYP